ncbi:hypothetical protein CTI12_AA355750 [Artemisia annua]|uniref:Maternal effect embryo arrest 22 n=1 Tax=Artemisia annua TaxID=35608 RepID=A0A2U1MQC6_ARTAN|nr:hypothetical protein CTI12_AA355750 [Artemisia annua]
MADLLVVKDESPCCSLWKAKYAKLQQKNTRAEEGRSALKQALAVFESEYDKMKKEYEKEKMRADNERNDKEKESAARVSLENEISSLKSEVLSLSQKGSSVPENVSEELKLLRGRVSQQEKELKRLQEEKKKANDVCESSKTDKNRVDQELSKLKAQLLKVETEKKHLKTDLHKEKARADSEKKRADEVLKTAKTEQAELEVLKAVKNNIDDLSSSKSEDKSLETEIGRLKELLDKEKKRADIETKNAETEKKNANKMKEMLKSEQSRANDLSSSKSEDKSLETEICRLKELLDKEKKRADIETKKAETEKKSANRMKEMLKSEQSRANEQNKLVDVERKKAEEFAHQLQKLKCEAVEAKSKLVSEGSKFKDANNKKIEAERKKTIKEKKKAEEQQKIAEMSTKHALEEKQRADMFKQQALSEKVRADRLSKELEDAKQRTKKACTELTNPSVVLVQKDLEAKSAELKLLKKRLKLEKERVKYADKVAELEKRCKKVVEEELHQLKLEFARFSNRVGLCNCFSVGKSCLEKDGNINSKRKFAHPVSGEVLLLPSPAATKTSECFKSSLDRPASSLPISRNCTESTSGTASKMEPLPRGSNRKNLDSSALVSSMASFSDRQLVSSQGICRLSNSKENSNPQLSSEANNNVRSPLRVRNNDGNSKKRKRLVNTEGETGHAKIAKTASALHGSIGNMDKPSTEGTQLSVMSIEKNGELGIRTVGDEDIDYNATHTCNKDLEVFKGMFDGDCMKLLNLDNEVEEEMYRTAVERPLSPTLPAIQLQSSQLVELDDSRPSEVTCNMSTVNTNGDSLEILGNGESGNTIIALIPSARSEDQDSIAVTGNSDLGHTGTKTSSGNEPGSAYDDSSHYIVVFPEIKAGSSLSKILQTTKTFTTQCCAFSQSEVIVKDVASALSADEVLSPKEKVCAFFSLFLKSFSSIASTKFSNLNDENFLNSIDVFSAQLKKVMSDEETRIMFTKVCDLDELLTLIQSFVVDGRVLVPVDISSETLPSPESKASLHQLVLGAVLLASVCAAFDRIDFIFETSYTISRSTNSSALTFLHVFAYVCGEKLLAHGDYSLIMPVVKSLVTYCEKENLSPGFPQCAKCPFSDGAVSMEELSVLLLKQLSGCCNNVGMTAHKSATDPDDALCNLGDALSLLELLASKMSWGWVCENIINELFKLLDVCAVEGPLTAVLVLLGQIARLGIDANGFQDTEVENIRVKLSSFISQSTSNKTGLPVQFAAVNALLGTTSVSFQELCNLSPLVSTSTGTDCIQKWFSLLSDEQKLLLASLLSADVS